MNFGKSIKGLRKKRGINQGQLAGAVHITQAYLSQIESNKRGPTLTVARAIAEVLEVPLPVLMFLSMDDMDIPAKKKEAFKIVGPAMRAMLEEFFTL